MKKYFLTLILLISVQLNSMAFHVHLFHHKPIADLKVIKDSTNKGSKYASILSEKYEMEYDSLMLAEEKQSFNYDTSVYTLQLFETVVIFYFVLGLVLTGVIFSGVQFLHGLNHSKPEDKQDSTELEFSAGSVKFKSTIFGIIILFLSPIFFLAYLIYVYPVIE